MQKYRKIRLKKRDKEVAERYRTLRQKHPFYKEATLLVALSEHFFLSERTLRRIIRKYRPHERLSTPGGDRRF